MLDIRCGELSIRDAPRFEDRGLFIKPGGFQGWGSLPASRREALARAVQHGEHDVPTYLPARVVTIDGWILADNDRDLGERIDQVTGFGGPGDRIEIVVTQHEKTRTAYGRRIIAEASDTGSALHRGEFQVQLVFADPRKYEKRERSPRAGLGTVIPVLGRGNFPSTITATIPDAPSSYTISSPGGTFTVAGAQAGGVHEVDFATGRVYRNGIYMAGVGGGPLWAIPNGETWTHVLSAPGAIYAPPTYI